MTIVVEDGTGLADAQSYVSIAYVDTYAAQRNNANWTGDNAKKEGAVIAATQFLDATFKFNGSLSSTAQALSFPRTDIYDKEGRLLSGVPERVKQACAELAMVAIVQSLITSPETAAVKRERSKVGDIEKEVEFAITSGSSSDASPAPMVDRLLSDLINTGSTSSIGGGFVRFVQG